MIREVVIRKIFTKKPLQEVRVFILVVLSLILFVSDHNFNGFSSLRAVVLQVVEPARSVANWPIDFAQIIISNFSDRQELLEENARFRSDMLISRVIMQRLGFLEHENVGLRELVGLSKKIKTKFLAAQLLALATDNFSYQVTIDKGKNDNLYVGQPALDAHGFFGQVIVVGPETSRVLLVTDSKSAVPVMCIRSGVQAIAVGIGSADDLELVNLPETADIKEGDILVTSRMGDRFSAGYEVGIVKEIKHLAGERFLKVLLKPSADIKSAQNVLLLWDRPPGQLKEKKQL